MQKNVFVVELLLDKDEIININSLVKKVVLKLLMDYINTVRFILRKEEKG